MPSLSELTAATLPELAAEVSAALPAGWQFDYDRTPEGHFEGAIMDGTGSVCWSDAQADERFILLNAFGWLHTRNAPAAHPAWVRGPLVLPKLVPLVSKQSDDPADLDPDQVESVYGAVDDTSD